MLPRKFLVAHKWYCNDTLLWLLSLMTSHSLCCNIVYCDKQQLMHLGLLRRGDFCCIRLFRLIFVYICNTDITELKKKLQSSTHIYEISNSITGKLYLNQNKYVCNNQNILSSYKSPTMLAIKKRN
jgi:hypothetical protein